MKSKNSIKIFTRPNCHSSKRTRMWLDEHHVTYIPKHIKTLTQAELIHILSLSDSGFESLLTHETRRNEKERNALLNLSFLAAVNYLLEKPRLLRTPIVVCDNKLQIGFNIQDIRQFIPQEKRKIGGEWFEENI